MTYTNNNLKRISSHDIINQIDDLIASGNGIDEIVAALSPLHVICNYSLLIEKGASDINLEEARDNANPIVVLNNLQTFNTANIPVNLTRIVQNLSKEDLLGDLLPHIRLLLTEGVDPQIITDSCMSAEDDSIVYFMEELPLLLEAGAKIDADTLVEKLLNDRFLLEYFKDESDIPTLKAAGVSSESLAKLHGYLEKHTS